MTMPPDFFSCDYFALFGVPVSASIDGGVLERQYRQLQAAAHPDRFAGGSGGEKQLAEQMASRINDAYQTLRSPLNRAAYILSLQGIAAFAEDNTAMPPDFLMQQIEWREALEEGDDNEREKLLAEIAAEENKTAAAAAAAIERADWEEATAQVRQWKYLQKMLAEYPQG